MLPRLHSGILFIIFYNGTKAQPDRQELRLSDSFADSGTEAAGRYAPALECVAHIVNINHGHNRELMESCRRLEEYARLVDAIRRYRAEGMTLRAAADKAIDECITNGVLTDILLKNRAEVTDMILDEYDEELHIRNEKQLSREEGLREGREQGQADAAAKFLKDGTLSPDQIARILGLTPETILKLQTEKA